MCQRKFSQSLKNQRMNGYPTYFKCLLCFDTSFEISAKLHRLELYHGVDVDKVKHLLIIYLQLL